MNRLAELGLELPAPFPAYGNYSMAARAGRLLISTGHVPVDGPHLVTGKLGRELTTEQGYRAAGLAEFSVMATLRGGRGG